MRLIAFLIMILAINFNLFAVEIPQFKNKIAIDGATIYQTDENGNLMVISFADVEYKDNYKVYKLLDKPTTNILFLDKINPYNTKELNYYDFYTNAKNKIHTNYFTFIIEDNLLMRGEADSEVSWLDDDPYDYNVLYATAIFVDYEKYGKEYINSLINKDLSMYSSRYFEGKYVSLDGKSYFNISRFGGGVFSVECHTPNKSIRIGGFEEEEKAILYPANKQIELNYFKDYNFLVIKLNVLDPNTLIVFEEWNENPIGLKGIYTKVRE